MSALKRISIDVQRLAKTYGLKLPVVATLKNGKLVIREVR